MIIYFFITMQTPICFLSRSFEPPKNFANNAGFKVPFWASIHRPIFYSVCNCIWSKTISWVFIITNHRYSPLRNPYWSKYKFWYEEESYLRQTFFFKIVKTIKKCLRLTLEGFFEQPSSCTWRKKMFEMLLWSWALLNFLKTFFPKTKKKEYLCIHHVLPLSY